MTLESEWPLFELMPVWSLFALLLVLVLVRSLFALLLVPQSMQAQVLAHRQILNYRLRRRRLLETRPRLPKQLISYITKVVELKLYYNTIGIIGQEWSILAQLVLFCSAFCKFGEPARVVL